MAHNDICNKSIFVLSLCIYQLWSAETQFNVCMNKACEGHCGCRKTWVFLGALEQRKLNHLSNTIQFNALCFATWNLLTFSVNENIQAIEQKDSTSSPLRQFCKKQDGV